MVSVAIYPAFRFVKSDTSVICHVLVYCFGSFLLQDMFLSLQAFAFEGQNMMFTVNAYIVMSSPAMIRTVCSSTGIFFSRVSYLPSYVFLRRRRSVTSRKLYACLEKFSYFLQLSDRVYVSGA